MVRGKVKPEGEAEAKASLIRASSHGLQTRNLSDLSMSRLKRG